MPFIDTLRGAPAVLAALGLACAGFAGPARAHPVISEFLALNNRGLTDEDDEASDWIELHNPTAAPVDLNGYYLTDNPGRLTKWRLPAVSLDAGGYLIVFASGKDRAVPGLELHTNFSLAGDGEFLALVSPDGRTALSSFAPEFPKQFTDVSYGVGVRSGVVTTETPVAVGSAARYYVPRTGEPEGGTGWRLPGFDDAGWAAGRSAFGFGYPTQPIGAGGDLSPVMYNVSELVFHGGVYLRFPFEIGNPAAVQEMTLRIKYDDGFAAYLNGAPVASANAPAPAVHNSVATASTEVADGDPFERFGLAFAGHLRAGENVLAIHGMNSSHAGSDFLVVPELDVRLQDLSQDQVPGYFEQPTPGAPNGAALPQFIKDTKFSVDRGFFDAPFQLAITSETPGVEIRYTTDGTAPSETHGTLYTGPITIDRTTTLQAAAFAPGFRSTNVDTQTYIFIDDILRQRNTGGLYWDTEMDPNVVNNPGTFTVAQALAAIPTLSIVMAPGDLFGPQGIYSNATQRASDNPFWERKCSAEYFYHPTYDGPYRSGDGFQIECGIVINGNFSRLSHNPKHSFRLKFKREHGPAKLDFPLFPDSPVDEYDTVMIRTGHNQGWATGHASTQMLRNQYARDIQGYDPAHAVAEGNHVHLYLNGQYWGLYNFHERPDDSFAAEHWGGRKEDYDGFKGLRTGESSQARIVSGDRNAWTRMFALADRDMLAIENYHAVLDLVDVDQLIDYTIGILYTGDRDGPTGIYPPAELPKNFYALRRRHPDGRFRFFRWDSEFIFEGPNVDMSERGGNENPAGLHKRLRRSPEYRLRFADRVHKYFFNGGAFTPDEQKADYLARAGQIGVAMVAESARWGDAKREPPYTRDANWLPERNRIVDNWMPARQSVILDQFRADNLYPAIEAPVFRIDGAPQHGGPAPAGAMLSMSAPQGTIYFTTDGRDPRTPDSAVEFEVHTLVPELAEKRAIMPTEPVDDGIWMDPGFDDSAWRVGTKGAGYERGTGFGPLLDANLDFAAQEDVFVDETIMMRVAFEIEDPSIYDTLMLLLRYDDGFVAYLNGVEVARDRTLGPPESPVAFNEPASEAHDDALAVDFQPIPLDDSRHLLRAGRNVLAVQALNFGTSSSDFLIWPMLEAREIVSGAIGNAPSPTSMVYSGAVTLQATGPVKARVLHNGAWSALADARYLVDSEPARAGNLVISELHYRPAAPSALEDAEGYGDRKDFEWIELLNIGSCTVDLAGVAFTEGIAFDFDRRSSIRHLEPGARLLVVKNREAFLFRDPAVDPALIAGEYGLRFSDDGEEVILSGVAGEIVHFTYNDRAGWPETPDGDGPSLVLRRPETNAALDDPASWRPSTAVGGSPGGDDRTALAAWMTANGIDDPHADPDGDGLTPFMVYAFGGAYVPIIEVRPFEVSGEIDEYLTLTYRLNGAAEDIEIAPEASADLVGWSALELVSVSRAWQPDGTAVVVVREATPRSAKRHGFVRVTIASNPG